MASLLSRLRKSKLRFDLLSDEFKRCYTLNHAPIVANRLTRSRSLVPVSDNTNFGALSSQLEFFCKARAYAAPFQANQKKEEKDTDGPRLNEQITSPSIRLVTDEAHYVLSRYEALCRAKELKMDLVEVDRQAKPPVCKILDYNKEKYIQQTKEKERAKSKNTLRKGAKEVRFAAKIKQKDLQIKADMAKRLMEKGYRVKCTAIEPTDKMDLETLLSRFSALIEDVAIEESGPKVEKKQAFIVVRHVKFGPAKKGSGKKASNRADECQDEEAAADTENTGSEELSGEDDDINIHNVPTKIPKPEMPAIKTAPPMENRYARDPRSVNPSRAPIQMNGRDLRNTVNSTHQIPYHGNQPQNASTSRQNEQKGYGIFSTQEVRKTPNASAESNRYKRSEPSQRR